MELLAVALFAGADLGPAFFDADFCGPALFGPAFCGPDLFATGCFPDAALFREVARPPSSGDDAVPGIRNPNSPPAVSANCVSGAILVDMSTSTSENVAI